MDYKKEQNKGIEDIMLKVTSLQRDEEGKDEEIRLSTPGKYGEDEDSIWVSYEETELVGLPGTVTTLRMFRNRQKAILSRRGTIMQEQEYILHKKIESVYETPMGNLKTSVMAKSMDFMVQKGKGIMHLSYDLEIKGLCVRLHDIRIELWEDKHGSQR